MLMDSNSPLALPTGPTDKKCCFDNPRPAPLGSRTHTTNHLRDNHTMQLNKIEQKFFSDVLRAELDIPIKANLRVGGKEFHVVIVPQISQHDYFEFRYFGTPAYVPEGEKVWNDSEIFGVHPVLEKAWNNRDIVNLELAQRPHPYFVLHNTSGPSICARVLVVEQNHRGRLIIYNNQILIRESKLARAEFSLVDFPKIVYAGAPWLHKLLAHDELGAFQDDLRSAIDRTGDEDVVISVTHKDRTNLHTKDGWEITLEEDDEQTRGCVSYTGIIKRQNEEEFEVRELNHILEGLKQFFSFACGAFRHPTAVIGYDSDSKVIWGQLGKFDLMQKSQNWFHHAGEVPYNGLLEHIFPVFWSKWEKGQNEITAAINYYINSRAMQQKGFPHGSVATIYSGLDLLAHLILPNPHKANSVSNIETALESHDIPNQCLTKSGMPISSQVAQKLETGSSGVSLLNNVRNYVAHPIEYKNLAIKQPPLKHLDEDYYPYFYIRDLGQFYLEYLLLRSMCDYAPEHHRPLYEKLHHR